MLAVSVSVLILTAAGAPAAFAVPGDYPAEGASAGATAAPGPHASMSGMDPDMPGMTHDETPGMTHDETPGMSHDDMPGMTHEETPGMTHEETPGMTHDETPGMTHDETPGMTHDETPGMDPDMPGMSGSGAGHGHGTTAGTDSRPQAAVVGTFAAVNGAVLLTAGLMRRRARLTAHKPSRASRPAK